METVTRLTSGGIDYAHTDVRAAAGERLARLPYTFRILLEQALRTGFGEDVQAILAWTDDCASEAEVSFVPRRLLMHDTTSVPALVDLASMRDVLAEAGGDPRRVNPVCPVATSVDHSLAVDVFGTADAMRRNVQNDIRRNGERYAFLKWAEMALDGFRVFPPGTGILHTINIEHLATVVDLIERGGKLPLAVPDTMLGTDSHTPMINALGVLGWGVGGLEGESAMLGEPLPIRLPPVIGVRLTGGLRAGVLAMDLALYVTEALRKADSVGAFVEFFGPGLEHLAVGARAAVANMAPEYGATTGFFPVDEATLRYLRDTGREDRQVDLVESYAKAIGLWHDPAVPPRYTRVLEIDLGTLEPTAAGPKRPHDRVPLSQVPTRLAGVGADDPDGIPDRAVAIAAITSCTNTADLDMLVTAALLARKAAGRGLQPPAWVKTSFAPGSVAMINALSRGGLMKDLESVGFHSVGIGCTTCIGHSGPLAPPMADAIAKVPDRRRAAVLSGNRNFPGRIHPDVDNGFLVSPPLVIAFALAGHLIDLTSEPVGVYGAGAAVYLRDLWPSQSEVDEVAGRARSTANTLTAYEDTAGAPDWRAIETPGEARFPWKVESSYLRRPPFVTFDGPRYSPGPLTLAPLAVFGDDVTTDHISPAGTIPADSPAGRHLVEAGERAADLNVYASRRGNFEVMIRGAFSSPSLTNHLCRDGVPGTTRVTRDGGPLSMRDAALHYREQALPLAILAGERYGTGSSRDWAAKAPALLGVRVVLARNFERIHRTNLICMGVIPVVLPEGLVPAELALDPEDRIIVALPRHPDRRGDISIMIGRATKPDLNVTGRLASETTREIDILKGGGILSETLSRLIG